jgi:mycoredoxin
VSELTMYTTVWCSHCRRLKAQLVRAGISFREVDIEQDAEAAAFVACVNGGNQTVPTVLLPDGSVLTHPTIDQIIEVDQRTCAGVRDGASMDQASLVGARRFAL